MRLINPSTEELLGDFPPDSPEEIERKLSASATAFPIWRDTPREDRAQRLRRLAEVFRRRRADLATLMAREMGKPVTAGQAEIDKCAGACDYFAEHGPKLLHDKPLADAPDGRGYSRFDPLGLILAITPWNFPFWQL